MEIEETKSQDPEVLSLEASQRSAVMEQAKKSVLILSPSIKQAIDILIQGVEMAQKAGVYTLQDAGHLCDAVNMMAPYCRDEENNLF